MINLILKIVLALVLLSVELTSAQQPSKDLKILPTPISGTRMLNAHIGANGITETVIEETPSCPMMAKSKLKTSEEVQLYPVTIIIDPSESGVDTAFAIDLTNGERMTWSEVYRKETVFEVPADTYLLQVSFSKDNWAVVFIPDVVVDGPKEIHVCRDMADVALTAEPLLPDGSNLVLPLRDEDYKPYGNYNVLQSFAVVQISYNNYTYDTFSVECDCTSVEYDKFMTMFTNLHSDQVRFLWAFSVQTKDDKNLVFHLDRTAENALTDNKISNNVDLFKPINVNINHSPAYEELGDENTLCSIEYNTFYPDHSRSASFMTTSPYSIDLWSCNDLSESSGIYSLITFASCDYIKYGRNFGGIYTPGASFEDGDLKFFSTPNLYYLSNNIHGEEPVPYNNNFSFESFDDLIFGNSNAYCLTTSQLIDWEEPSFTYIIPTYLGNLDEIRTIDSRTATVEVKYDGEIAIERQSVSNLYSALQEWWSQNKPTKQIFYTFYNENIDVNGMNGSSVCEVIVNTTGDDMVNPTIQRIMLRNKNGNPSIHFQNPEEGVLSIAGGDFIPHSFEVDGRFGPEQRDYFSCEPVYLTVSYSPNDRKSFRALRMKEIPENFFMPGYGAYWEADMSDMDLEDSENGWYDLQVEMVDQSGNVQRQTISPAFYIDSPISVSQTTHDASIRVEGNNIIAPSAARIYNVNGIQTDGHNLVPGIYLVRHLSNCVKIQIN